MNHILERLFEIQWKIKHNGQLGIVIKDNRIEFITHWRVYSDLHFSMEFSLDQIKHGNINLFQLFIDRSNQAIEQHIRIINKGEK